MKVPQPYRECSCRAPETGRRLGQRRLKFGQKGHGGWYARYEVPVARTVVAASRASSRTGARRRARTPL